MNLAQSRKMHSRALEIIPSGTNTNSKRVEVFLTAEHFPSYIEKAKGAYVWDLDGNKYVDYIASLAPVNIGYSIDRINSKIRDQLEKGILFSLPSSNEVELSEMLIEKIPGAEMVRFLKTGAEVTSAAVRIARLVTGRDMVLSCGYHGWHDWWSAKINARGIPQSCRDLIANFQFNDFDQLKRLVDQHEGKIACIFLTAAEYGAEPKNEFLQKIRQLADEKNILLIFDEIVTGFRWAMGGAQEKYGVIPDLAAFGKGMANGMPIAAVVGKKQYMSQASETFITSTYASEALSIAAAIETIRILEEEQIITKLYRLADALRQGLHEIAKLHHIQIETFDPTPVVKYEFHFGDIDKNERAASEFMRYCVEHGILTRRYGSEMSLCPMGAHTNEDVEFTLDIFDKAVAAVKSIVS